MSNAVAISMYHSFGYSIYRQVLGYYSGEEDAYDMRKAMRRDTKKESVIPLKAPITPDMMNGINGEYSYINNHEEENQYHQSIHRMSDILILVAHKTQTDTRHIHNAIHKLGQTKARRSIVHQSSARHQEFLTNVRI